MKIQWLAVAALAGMVSCQNAGQKPAAEKTKDSTGMVVPGNNAAPVFDILANSSVNPVAFTLKPSAGKPLALEVNHEKELHFIIVNEALNRFFHVHPAKQADGSFTISQSLPPDSYLAYADYKLRGQEAATQRQGFVVGQQGNQAVDTTEQLQASSGNYSVQIKLPQPGLSSGGEQMIEAPILLNGKPLPADQLNDYLGAKAHVVLIHAASKDYIHVHPMVHGGTLALHASFPQTGAYRGWMEFVHQGKKQLVSFTLKVAEGSGGAASSGHDGHGGHSGH